MRHEACSIDALDACPKRRNSADDVGSLLDECFRTAVEQFDGAAKVLEARW